MTRAKLTRTLILTGAVMCIAVSADYMLNVGLLRNPAGFTPYATLMIAAVIAVPVTWLLSSQHVNLATARDQQLMLLKAREQAISEAEDALARLRSSEALYRLLADNLTDSISLWSADGRRIYCSPSIERLLGFTPEEYLDTPGHYGVRPEDHARVMAVINSLEAGADSRTSEYRRCRKDGREIWIESTHSRLDDGCLISTSRDITERKRLQLDLEAALVDAQSAVAAKADFLANMTHELRTPLNAIIGFSGVLRGSSNLTPQDSRHVELIHTASATLLGVVNDVLDFSRLEAGGLELDPQPFDPVHLVRSACALIEDQATEKGLTLTLDLGSGVRGMVGDGPRLSQVLLNFLSNAVKFTGAGHVAVSLRQVIDGEQARLRVEVIDTGIGIPESQIAGIFERFAQADAGVSRQFGGTGLGLAISKRIIDRMDGQIGVVSTPGRGSTFWFEIELPAVCLVTARPAFDAAATSFAAPLRVLLVEDNAVNRELVCAMLDPFDIALDTARDGVEGLEAAQRGTYDLILMDVQMPIMDGLTATRRIRAHDPDVPIIAMTANVLPVQIANCLAAGMNDHIGKPIHLPRLLETVARWTQVEA
jgi:PAS domain S-box-containing protein